MSRLSYDVVPSVRIPRSAQDLSHSVKTSMSVGKVYPIDWVEVLPNETIKSRDTNVSRITSAFLKPVMDNLYLDTYSFYVPYRLLYDKAEEVFGVAKPSAYTNDELASFPGTYGEVVEDSVAERLGLPLGSLGSSQQVQLLPARAFALIYEWYLRNQNVVDEMYVQTGERQESELFNKNAWAPNNYTGLLPNAPKIKDQFVSCLPQPQKGPEVLLPLSGSAPVTISADGTLRPLGSALQLGTSLPQQSLDGYSTFTWANTMGVSTTSSVVRVSGKLDGLTVPGGTIGDVTRTNLIGTADLSSATASSINDQRIAWQMQKMLERDAIFGTRYNSFVYGHFGQYIKDSRLQIPELLGGKRIPLNVMQVAQTSQGTEESPLANLSAYSWTTGKSRWSRHFPEHGMVMTIGMLRYRHTYQQGIPKKWTRFQRSDFYDPLFATIGFQPVYQTEIFKDSSDSSTPLREKVFGYNEAWIEYRRIPSYVTGAMRSSVQNSLDIWHFADNYAEAPTLSKEFIEETPEFVDRTLAVPSTSLDSFIFDFYFDMLGIMPMPSRSVPGLVDHH